MNMKIIYLLVFGGYICGISFGQEYELRDITTTLNDNEKKIFKKIKTIYPEINYTENVIQHNINEGQVLVEMLFEKDQKGFIWNKYNDYSITFLGGAESVKYKSNISNSTKCEGVIISKREYLIRIERKCDKTSCRIKVYKNNKTIFDKKD